MDIIFQWMKEYQQDNGTPVIMCMVQHPDIFIPTAVERAKSKGLHIPFAEIVSEKNEIII